MIWIATKMCPDSDFGHDDVLARCSSPRYEAFDVHSHMEGVIEVVI